jgi:hypothetical protein
MSALSDAERRRLENQRLGLEDWRFWGPYLSERAWATVREDYSKEGNAWEYFDYGQSCARAYRWSEDGLGGISDSEQRLCFGLALWNGKDPVLKERAFGLSGKQGNRGEDVKECYFYLDATPSHAWLHYLYKYPHSAFPYRWLSEENARRSRRDPPFGLIDSGVFADDRYWDIEVFYAKALPDEVHIRIAASNRGGEAETLWLLPQLWFRNTWSWSDEASDKPVLHSIPEPGGAAWGVAAEHSALGTYYLYGRQDADLLYTNNDSNNARLWGSPGEGAYVKDAFHRYLTEGEHSAVNPEQRGTKFGAAHMRTIGPGETATIELVLSATRRSQPFLDHDRLFPQRLLEADSFYLGLLPEAADQDHKILRQSLAGMIWNKQFVQYDVSAWLKGDRFPPPKARNYGRNHQWRHLRTSEVVSVPDKWEFPWFSSWDLAFHCAVFALIDVDFAKNQIELLLHENYLHPDGRIPSCEWALGDTSPPVHAMGALKVFRAERVQRSHGDVAFLKRVLHKLLLNHAWWINRKDAAGRNVFEGGFLGLDNISVYDHSRPLPGGYVLKQSEATGWMAMLSLQLAVIALEITVEDPAYEDMAIQCYQQFMAVATTLRGHTGSGVSLWDEADGFFKDLVAKPDEGINRVDAFSWTGIIPLFACEVIDARLLESCPRFAALLRAHEGGMIDGHQICACPFVANERGEHLLSLVDPSMLGKILPWLFNEDEFLSPHGVRSVSRRHAAHEKRGHIPSIGDAVLHYQPGESESEFFGGNSNWRGPVWMPVNYLLIQSIEKLHRYLGDTFTFPAPCLNGYEINLKYAATLLSERLADIFRRDESDLIPAFSSDSPHQTDPYWSHLLLFHEYFHAETGLGLGASHQTGWSGLVANLVMRRYRQDVPDYWKRQRTAMTKPAS